MDGLGVPPWQELNQIISITMSKENECINSIGNVDNLIFASYADTSVQYTSLWILRYTLKGRCNIGNAGKTASMSMLTLFDTMIYITQGTCDNIMLITVVSLTENIVSMHLDLFGNCNDIHWRK